jgi:hypothetical protein
MIASLLGCAKHGTKTAKFGTSDEILSAGVYSAQNQDAGGLATKLSLNQNHTYSRKKFQGPCLLMENRGEWKSDHDAIEFHLTEIRKRSDCNTEDWQVEKMDNTLSRMLRNVTPNSFDLLDQEEEVSAQWVRFIKR